MAGILTKSGGGRGANEFSEITIGPAELSDLDDFLQWAMDDKVTEYCTWDTYTSKEQALDYFKDSVIPHPWCRAICINNRAIGAILVTPNSSNDKCRAELGYALGSKYWGKGIATEAVKMVASTIFAECPHLERLEAISYIDNKASQRVLEKAGFEKEGVLRKYKILKGRSRDVVMFSFISTDKLVG